MLWVRSYWWIDSIDGHNDEISISGVSGRGEVGVDVQPYKVPFRGPAPRWHYECYEPNYNESMPREIVLGFMFHNDANERAIIMPYWALLFPAAGFTTCTWVRWSKQFSLRTLLIATTLIALLLGLAVYATR
jgi:hypothetical protein